MLRLVLAVLLAGVVSPCLAQWTSKGRLNVPEYHYTFLATTPQGDLLAGTYNRSGEERELPALLIKRPTSDAPEVVELSRIPFPFGRGFSGLACDEKGNYFVSGDTGVGDSSFVSKFAPDGSSAREFGTSGVLLPGRRCLGLDVLGNHLLVAVDWGEILVLRTDTGARVGTLPKAPGQAYIRDIAVDPRSMRVFGVARGAIHTWGGGAPWRTSTYAHREITEPTLTEPVMGEGIALDPFKRCVVIAPPFGGSVREVFGDGNTVKSRLTSLADKSSLTDVALSFDGTTLFVSDYVEKMIHVLERPAPEAARPKAESHVYAALAPRDKGGPPPVPVTWQTSLTETQDKARALGRPMLVYFRIPTVKNCQGFEDVILKNDEFARRIGSTVCVTEDAAQNPLLARSMGVFIVPSVILFDSQGNVVAEHKHPIDPLRMMDDLERLRGG